MTVLREITRDETTAEAERAATRTRLEERLAELNELLGAVDLAPEAPATRTTDRAGMAGAPLWRLVDFAGTTADEVRGPIEAALQAAGLLDAWVGPAGWVDGHDIFADPDALGRAPGRSLADVLTAETHPDVTAGTVHRLLESVAYGWNVSEPRRRCPSAWSGRWPRTSHPAPKPPATCSSRTRSG
jgi:hypothetical protein